MARIAGKAEFTVREWCRLGRIRAIKKWSGRGKHQGWAIPHEELLRYQREGLLADRRGEAPRQQPETAEKGPGAGDSKVARA